MRPTNKEGLLNESQSSFNQLIELVKSIPDNERLTQGVNGEWSVKDVLAHLGA